MFTEHRNLTKERLRRVMMWGNILLAGVFAVLLFLFWNTQVLKTQYYTELANRNITKDIDLVAPRGLITDRKGRRLSDNKLNFSLFLVRADAPDRERSVALAAAITGRTQEEIGARIAKYAGYPSSFMIPLEKDLPLDRVIYIESRSDQLPEFAIEMRPARAYPYNELASHVLGYISELTSGELNKRKDGGYKLGDIIGKSGIEKQYENELRGTRGTRTVARDNLGLVRRTIAVKKALIGATVTLTLDLELQQYVEELFLDHKGTVGVVDLQTGGILAMVSKPNFNPEFFTGVMAPEEWSQLVNNPDRPLHNKFLQGLYSPGSVFKTVVALAALEEKLVDRVTPSHCSGALRIYDRNFHCWRASGHGTMTLVSAMKNSCNIYFYRLGKKLDIDTIAHYADLLGLGDRTHIDLPNEKKGLLPTRAWKQDALGQKWFPGETISVAIGGGMLSVTPIQALQMISTVALRGQKPRFHLLKTITKNNRILKQATPVFRKVPIAPENFELVIEGLYRVVNDGGTGAAARLKGLDVCGKTGTQQVISKENPNYKELVKQKQFKPHAWFVSFAPRVNPRIAMVVFVENGGDAGAIAAPIAGKIYKKIFLEKDKENNMKIKTDI